MTISKQFLKSKPECKVKFTLTAEESGYADTVTVVGDFNGWDAESTPMKKNKDGDFSVTVNLLVGGSQQFRYCVNGDKWMNDAEADGYQFCSFAGVDNSLLAI